MKDDIQKIHAVMILEVIGKPAKHLTDTLELLIDEIGKEQGITVKSKEVKEPRLMGENSQIAEASGKEIKIQEHKDFYISFAEVEVESENILSLVFLMFKYMPAHIEIISPENVPLTNGGWNDILNDLMRRLHGYDEIARVLQVEKAILESKLKALLDEAESKKEAPKEKVKKLKKHKK